jgi:hypothetical protein
MFVRISTALALLGVLVAIAAHPSGSSGHEQVYVVRRFDTLWSIASARLAGDPREGVWRIRERNRLGGATIRPGQRLILPP